jgi:hypothetical protein
LPKGATHYLINLINLIDENNFPVSYPEMSAKVGQKYSTIALPVNGEVAGMDQNKDGVLSPSEM